MRRYQRKLLAHFAPFGDPAFLESLLKNVVAGDVSAQRLYAEMRGYIAKGGGVTVNTQINNDNSQKTAVVAGNGFDSIVRQLAEKRRLSGVQALTLDATASAVDTVSASPAEPLE